MAEYDLGYLLGKARNGTLADDDPDLQTLRRHAEQGASGARAALTEVTEARRGSGGSVNKVI